MRASFKSLDSDKKDNASTAFGCSRIKIVHNEQQDCQTDFENGAYVN